MGKEKEDKKQSVEQKSAEQKFDLETYMVSKAVREHHKGGMRAFAKHHQATQAPVAEWDALFKKY